MQITDYVVCRWLTVTVRYGLSVDLGLKELSVDSCGIYMICDYRRAYLSLVSDVGNIVLIMLQHSEYIGCTELNRENIYLLYQHLVRYERVCRKRKRKLAPS